VRVEWSRRALDQLREIFDYIVRDRPNVTVENVDGLFDATGLLFHMPGEWTLTFDVTEGPFTERAEVVVDAQP